ncbi:MAG: hypothetical protein AAFY65_17985 [Pseudomonadota bacterium]
MSLSTPAHSVPSRFAVVASLSLVTASAALGQGFEFPGRVENLPHGHYWSWRGEGHGAGPNDSQLLGYDFGMQRFDPDAGRFIDLIPGATDADVNANRLIWNRPVYAHRAGVVRRCWAEAPDNPSPSTKHARVAEIFPGGNMVWLDHGDGTVTLYAHFREGSVPEEVCTNRDAFHPEPRDANADVAPGGERTVAVGQFLGCIGHSGSSTTGPHLHIHSYEMAGGDMGPPFGPAVPLPFRSVRTKAVSLTRDQPSDWRSTLNAVLPRGQAELVLPAPMEPPFDPRAVIGVAFPTFQTRWQEAEAAGYRITDLEVHRVGGDLRFNGIFEPGNHPPLAHIGLDFDTFLDRWREAEGDGFRLADLETWTSGGSRVFAGIFEPGTFPPAALIGRPLPDFLDGWRDLEAQGQRLWDFETHMDGNTRVFSGIFRPGSFPPAALVGLGFQDFVDGARDLERQGMRLHDFETWRAGGQRLYAGVFRPGTYRPGAWFNQTGQTFLPNWTEFELLGYRMKDLEVHTVNGSPRFFGTFDGGPPLPNGC